ncbi:MAG: phosphopantetheine-binding protein [Vicinamibacterales bacterium]
MQQAFGIDLPLRALFDNPSVRELAAEIDRLLPAGGAGARGAGSATIARG